MIRRYPNEATLDAEGIKSPLKGKLTQRTETSKYLVEKKTNSDSLSSGERTGNSPNQNGQGHFGVVGLQHKYASKAEASGKQHHRG